MTEPTFPKRDPASEEFWNLRYGARFCPWDAGDVPQRLREFVATESASRRVLVPGCGSARDVRHFAANGWDVRGIDFSAQAVDIARMELGAFADRVELGDFFAPIAGEPFDIVYERAFLCSLPRRLWPAWGERMAGLVAPRGLLVGFFFFDDGERGPPFALHSSDELATLLDPAFTRVEDKAVADSLAVFRDRERWQVWHRSAA